MKRRETASAPDVAEVRTRFEHWRQNRKGKARIPQELWCAAVEVKTATVLHLDGGKLKRRMMDAGSVTDKTCAPAFVEMVVPHAGAPSECTIELEGRKGKLRIHWTGATAAGLAGLSRALWDAAS
jgi:acetoacetate decarboxylase